MFQHENIFASCVDCFAWFCSSFPNYQTFRQAMWHCTMWRMEKQFQAASLRGCIVVYCVHLRNITNKHKSEYWLSTNASVCRINVNEKRDGTLLMHIDTTVLIMLVRCCERVVIIVFIWFVLQRVCSGQKRSVQLVVVVRSQCLCEQFYPSLFMAAKSVKNKPNGKYKRIVFTWRVPKNIVQSIKLAGRVWRYLYWSISNALIINHWYYHFGHIKCAVSAKTPFFHRWQNANQFRSTNRKCTRANCIMKKKMFMIESKLIEAIAWNVKI